MDRIMKYLDELIMINEMNDHFHLFGYEATLQIPQVFPLASLMNPFSPQDVAQEFLTLQYWSVTPTKRTP
jgi:hypothetical protein